MHLQAARALDTGPTIPSVAVSPVAIPINLLTALNALSRAKKTLVDQSVLESLRAHVYEQPMESPPLLEDAVRRACMEVPKGLVGFEEIADIALEVYLHEYRETEA